MGCTTLLVFAPFLSPYPRTTPCNPYLVPCNVWFGIQWPHSEGGLIFLKQETRWVQPYEESILNLYGVWCTCVNKELGLVGRIVGTDIQAMQRDNMWNRQQPLCINAQTEGDLTSVFYESHHLQQFTGHVLVCLCKIVINGSDHLCVSCPLSVPISKCGRAKICVQRYGCKCY